jgi:hypothetical protein
MNVSGQWTIIQMGPGTNRFEVAVNIQPVRPDGSFVLTATHSNGTVAGGGFGSVRDGHFTIRITWTNNTEGVYSAVFDPQGFLFGSAFDVRNPTNIASWKSSKSFS